MPSDRNESLKERAPLLLVFGDLAPRVAALIRVRPILVARLVVAPREAVHAIGAYLHLAPGAAQPDADVADAIDGSAPRDLLRAALPGCPPCLYRALDRAGDTVRGRAYYERLGAVARGPFGGALLGGDAPLSDERFAFFEALAGMDPAVAGARAALPECSYPVEALGSLATYLRARGVLAERDFRLPPGAGMAAVMRRVQRGLDALRAPAPGFAPPPPLRVVETVGELRRIGARLKNCVHSAQHFGRGLWFDLAEGHIVFLVGDDPPLLAAVRRVGPGLVLLEQAAGPENAALPPGTHRGIQDGLRAAGLRVVPQEPSRALGTLAAYADKPPRGRAEDEGEGDDTDGEWDELAA